MPYVLSTDTTEPTFFERVVQRLRSSGIGASASGAQVQRYEPTQQSTVSTRSQREIVSTVQYALNMSRSEIDGKYGPKTNAKLRDWAKNNRVTTSQFDHTGPTAIGEAYPSLGLRSIRELNILGDAYQEWRDKQASTGGTHEMITSQLVPPIPEDAAIPVISEGWFSKYWWAVALGVLGIGVVVTFVTTRKSTSPPSSIAERATILPAQPVGRWRS